MVQNYDGALDRGLEGVVACHTAISTIIDTTLCYRGYKIEDLAENASFEEVIYLLWNGEKPNEDELNTLKNELNDQMTFSPDFINALKALPVKNVHPMSWLRSAVSCLALWDTNSQTMTEEAWNKVAINLMSKTPLMVAFFERLRKGLDWKNPVNGQSVAWNFLYLMNDTEPTPAEVEVFDKALTLHADHELNCSAFSARVTASSLSDIYSAVTSAIGSLKGPLHGGANEQVMLMLKRVGSETEAKSWVVEALKNKEKIMGFGHRVYKNGDPRAKILKVFSEKLCKEKGLENYYNMSAIIEDTVVSEKGLLPNVDFYSATTYYALGIPLDLYTPIFALSRMSGWLAHVLEQYSNNRIYRPRGKWSGSEIRTWN